MVSNNTMWICFQKGEKLNKCCVFAVSNTQKKLTARLQTLPTLSCQSTDAKCNAHSEALGLDVYYNYVGNLFLKKVYTNNYIYGYFNILNILILY